MRILFATDSKDKISTQLNAPNFAKLNEIEGVQIDFYNHNYADYDVVLFMGYDARVAEARAAKPDLKIGVIDLRFIDIGDAQGADFAIANGVEITDWLSIYFENIFIYPIYPQVKAPLKKHANNKPLLIGYHGNKLHLLAMQPHITRALEALAETNEIELWAVYDIRSLGEMPKNFLDANKIKVRYFQWEEDVYDRVISQVDIGIVPNLIPMQDEMKIKKLANPFSKSLPNNPHADYLLRFKKTTNAGRIYVFSQLGIPVVAGMSPSAAQAIRHGESGYLALGTGGWYHGLKKLADSAGLRTQLGSNLNSDFQNQVSPNVLNRKFIEFIQNLSSSKQKKDFPFYLSLQESDESSNLKNVSLDNSLIKRIKNSIRKYIT